MFVTRRHPRCTRPAAAALALLACWGVSGCLTPLGQGWADYKTRRQVEEAAADDSFPNAAEVGLASDSSPNKTTR